MLDITSEVIVTGMPGDEINDFVDEAFVFYESHYMQTCVLTFNGWFFKLDKKYNPVTQKEVVNKYLAYCNS